MTTLLERYDEVLAADGKVLRCSYEPSNGQAALQMVTVYATKARGCWHGA